MDSAHIFSTDWNILMYDSGPFGMEHTAFAPEDTPSLFMVGDLPASLGMDFDKEVEKRLFEAQKIPAEKRSAENGAESHQKTPSFVLALLRNAITTIVNKQADTSAATTNAKRNVEREREVEKELDRPPQGGVTDVGLQTGGRQRHTTWPLVCAVVHVSPIPR